MTGIWKERKMKPVRQNGCLTSQSIISLLAGYCFENRWHAFLKELAMMILEDKGNIFVQMLLVFF